MRTSLPRERFDPLTGYDAASIRTANFPGIGHHLTTSRGWVVVYDREDGELQVVSQAFGTESRAEEAKACYSPRLRNLRVIPEP